MVIIGAVCLQHHADITCAAGRHRSGQRRAHAEQVVSPTSCCRLWVAAWHHAGRHSKILPASPLQKPCSEAGCGFWMSVCSASSVLVSHCARASWCSAVVWWVEGDPARWHCPRRRDTANRLYSSILAYRFDRPVIGTGPTLSNVSRLSCVSTKDETVFPDPALRDLPLQMPSQCNSCGSWSPSTTAER